MQVIGSKVNTKRRIIGRVIVESNLDGKGGSRTQFRLTLECGHEIMRSYSDAKNLISAKCPECGMSRTTIQAPESGPFRHRQSPQHLDRRLRRRLSPGSLGLVDHQSLSDSEHDE